MNLSKSRRKSKVIFIICFIAFLTLPIVDSFTGLSKFIPLYENRNFAIFPPMGMTWIDIKSFPSKFDEYYKDHFGFRSVFISLNTIVKTKVFGVSPNKKVLIGKDGWLYFAGENSAFLKYPKSLTSNEVQDYVNQTVARRDYYRKQGIDFFVIVVPNKQSIYPEFLPKPQSRWIKSSTPYDQINSRFVQTNNSDFFIDLKSVLLKEKAAGKVVYFKTDSHWNKYAALSSLNEVLSKMSLKNHKVAPFPSDAFKSVPQMYSGDLVSYQLGIRGLFTETTDIYTPQSGYFSTTNKVPAGTLFHGKVFKQEVLVSENKKVKNLKAVVIRDSQMIPIISEFSENFSRVVFIAQWEDPKYIRSVIDAEKPDIILHELVERSLGALLIHKP